MSLYREILDRYETMSFLRPDGTQNPYTMIPMVTELLQAKGLQGDGTVERVAGVDVYPSEWFNPFEDATGRLRKTGNTRTIHWYAKSWMPIQPAWKVNLKRLVRRLIRK